MDRRKKGRPGRALFFLLLFLALLPRVWPAEEIPYAWTGVERVVAVADLHGDYDQFVYILAHPQVGLIDNDLHWIGGKAHLVQLGDVADRGNYARRIYDLIIRLEKEAAAAGGGVHMVLGNHEEMNITGIALDYPRYVTVEQFVSFLPDDFRKAREAEYIKTLPPEERKRAEIEGLDVLTDQGLADFWQRIIDRKDAEARRAYVLGFNDAVGDWLLKQNTVIKINDVIYVHGGINETLSKWSLREINTVMRQELAYFQGIMRDPQRTSRAFHPKLVYDPESPLWFRGLAERGSAAQAEVDRILANLGAKAMVIGHNFFAYSGGRSPRVAKQDVARFQDKVWIMDTGISGSYGGVPSALIYEDGEFRLWGESEEVAKQSGIKPPPAKPLTRRDMETFLRTAKVVRRGPGPGGRTDAWRLTLESGDVALDALFKYVDRRRPAPLADSYRYELAAYALSKYLDVNFVPPIVERTVEAAPGAVQVFIPNAMSEEERKSTKTAPADPEAFEKTMADLLVFQNLAYDDCHNERDTLISRDDGRIYRVDFSEAFAPDKSLPPRCPILRCSRLLFRKLQAWDEKTVADYVGRFLNSEEIEALNDRRHAVVRMIEMQIRASGERTVLF
ncbi:MAG TPA: metallophosphoesterase [Acidobacteriota bacterium]|nr:metallophosphoesterase [Acidobacteriota bacterium]